ncbi:DUF2381 family protein [Archangium lansingense]|uniref:DUF2381 family protein n=1 Tax=Archangium lansingense TaxID=2995310 RepID=UPI003B7BB0B3
MPLLLPSLPATARERPAERVSRRRTLHVSTAPGEALPEVLVAGGTATVVATEVPLGPGGPVLEDERGRVRLVPVDGSSFIVLPSADVSEGEQLVLTVPMPPGDSLRLALVTRRGEVDGEVRLIRLQVPEVGEAGVDGVVRLLQDAPKGRMELTLPKTQVSLRGSLLAQVDSVLRMGQHVFVTLSTPANRKLAPSARDWNRLRLRASLEGGASVRLPHLYVPASASPRRAARHILVAILPGGTLRLWLEGEGADATELALTLP